MADENKALSYTECSCCGSEVAVKETKKGKPYYNCAACGQQTFFRMPRAIEIIRSRTRSEPKKIETEVKTDEPIRKERPSKKPAGGFFDY